MSDESPTLGVAATDAELAAALDSALDALQAGRPVDRHALLARFPQLTGALDALDHLDRTAPTLPAGAASPAALPERIGPYLIERELGSGGFGVVYQAYDPDVKRRVALKLLHPGRLAQPEAVARFHREARATARLHHPGIVRLFDYSRTGPPFYLVTEFIEGVELSRWRLRERPSPQRAAEMVAQIAEAVEHAHAQGTVHRDLKPANVLVDAAGNPHVLDFGLARFDALTDDGLSTPTSDGRILGSLPYMAPEQAAGHSHDADARSDVWSLGVILYELLTGRLPFEGPAHSLPARVVEENPPPPRLHNPALPADGEAVCLKALAKQPRDRYPTAADLARDLRAFEEGRPVEARPLTWASRLHKTLDRRHHDTRTRGWTLLVVLQGLLILAGSSLANCWELWLTGGTQWLAILATKLVQGAAMLVVAQRLRPLKEPTLTAAERQIWAVVPAYFGAFAALMVVNLFLPQPIPLAPVMAVLSGMGFVTLGATIWGWNYVWGGGFFALAVLVALFPRCGLLLLGTAWFACLLATALYLRRTR